MTATEVIKKAKTQGRNTLTEAESKEVLREYGIAVVEEITVKTITEAEIAAEKTGYPVVVKGLGAKLTHKTERGLVKLNLRGKSDVKKAASFIRKAAGKDLEGYLIQPMMEGKREFVAGLFHDSQFGPVVMFGLGGIFTEALSDVVFRIAPIDEQEAGVMIDELHARKLLGDFRGEKAPDREALVKALVGLSRIGMEVDEIKEIDINPLLVGADGKVTAVDALVVMGEKIIERKVSEPVPLETIDRLFHPKSIAFIGASAVFLKWGQMLFSNVVAGNFGGEIYLVNDKGGVISDRRVYTSVTEIPGPVDMAIITIPASKVLAQIPDLRQKGIKHVLLISAGFGEIGGEGKALEAELVRQAREAGIILIGPNTMGICNPHISFYCTGGHIRPQAGGTALVSQSGNMGMQLLGFADKEGIGIRAFTGTGNEAMLTIEDCIDGLEYDELSTSIVLYVESAKDGRRFYQSAKRVSKKKPIIILKGGRTEAGAKAAASHTGAMASNVKVFEAACRQAGIIQVKHPMDLLDLSAAFSSLPLIKGNRVAMMTMGGGWGVVASDLCIENGLVIPKLTDDLIARLDKVLPAFWSRSNPVDLVAEGRSESHLTVLEELVKWDGCDAVIHMGIVGRKKTILSMIESTVVADKNYNRQSLEKGVSVMEGVEKTVYEKTVELIDKYQKPVLGVYLEDDGDTRTVRDAGGGKYKCITFTTPERVVNVLSNMRWYAEWLKRQASAFRL